MLLVRGLWSRRVLAVGVLLVAIVAVGSAALGPLYARAADESVLRDGLTGAPAQSTGLDFRAQAGVHDLTASLSESNALLQRLPAPGSIRAYPSRIRTVSTVTGASLPDQPGVGTTLVAREGACAQLRIVDGRCAERVGEVVVSARTLLLGYGWRVGEAIALDDGTTVRIVGSYVPLDPTGGFWFGVNYFDQQLITPKGPVADSLFTVPAEFRALPAATQVTETVDYPFDPAAIRLADVPRLSAAVEAIEAEHDRASHAPLTTDLPGVLRSAAHQESLVDVGTALVTLQVGVLTWLVLFEVTAGFAEERRNEIALAKLRGFTPAHTFRFGVGQVLTLCLLALPIGFVLAVSASRGLAGAVLVPGTPVIVQWNAVLAAVVAVAGCFVAGTVTLVRVIRRPVLEQWRSTTQGVPHRRGRRLLEVGAFACAAGGLIALEVLQAAGVPVGDAVLLAPALLVLVVAMLGSRALPVLLRGVVRGTRATGRTALLLAARQVVRRPAAERLAVLLTVAIGLVVFSAGAEGTAVANRADRADAEVGAARTLAVSYVPGVDPVLAARRASIDGDWAMAAATWLPSGGGSVVGTVLAVDPTRYGAVAATARGGLAAMRVGKLAAGDGVPVVTFSGTRIRATITARSVARGAMPDVQFDLRDSSGKDVEAQSGPLQDGSHQYTASAACAGGCTFVGITWVHLLYSPAVTSGTATVSAVDAGGMRGAMRTIGLRLRARSAWRADAGSGTHTDAVRTSAAGVTDRFTSTEGGYGGVAYATFPDPITAVSTRNAVVHARTGLHGTVQDDFADGAPFEIVATSRVLPEVLDTGVVMSAPALEAALPTFADDAHWQIWLSDRAPADAIALLREQGLIVQPLSSQQQDVVRLSRQGPALSLLLLLVSAVLSALLAAATTAVTIAAASRRRSYEFAALEVVGVRRPSLLGAAFLEQALPLGAAAVLGGIAGTAAAFVAVPAIPEFATGTPVALTSSPAIVPILAVTVATALLLAAVALACSLGVLRQARPDRLREGDA